MTDAEPERDEAWWDDAIPAEFRCLWEKPAVGARLVDRIKAAIGPA